MSCNEAEASHTHWRFNPYSIDLSVHKRAVLSSLALAITLEWVGWRTTTFTTLEWPSNSFTTLPLSRCHKHTFPSAKNNKAQH
jgi:hypothetical protein